MIKVLVFGENSFVGDSFKDYLRENNKFSIDIIDSISKAWEGKDFSDYDSIFFVAGIVHLNEKSTPQDLYYDINYKLPIRVAKKAQQEGVSQFIFLSTMSVYGVESGEINPDTQLAPNSHYGKSKLMAETELNKLQDDNFKVAIIRPPMIYGKGCKGNYPRLRNLVFKTPLFPNIDNQRSMVYIDNLCQFIAHIMEEGKSGIFFPQNKDYVKTTELVKLIAEANGKKIKLTKLFNPFIKIMKNSTIEKVFGNLTYDKEMSVLEGKENNEINYNIVAFNESIKMTEKRGEKWKNKL